ncbi:MAG: hypothetical protein EAX96_17330 [Candidatus Lokiarchaeota archaeon]|nr:hypothetical protein [Candidatus Lokiarchaeota archaeon]
MQRKYLILILAIIIISVVVPLVLVIPSVLPQSYTSEITLEIPSDDWNHVGVTLDQGERWIVDFTSNGTVTASLMTWDQFMYFYAYGSVGGCLQSISNTSGHFEFTQSLQQSGEARNVVVVFQTSSAPLKIVVTTTEYRIGLL